MPKFLYISQGLENHETARISYATIDYKMAPYKRLDYEPFEELPPKPSTYDMMVEYSKLLSKNIPFARVDWYEVNKHLYFSEMTFYPGGGLTGFEPSKYDAIIGDYLKLNNE